MPNQTTIIGALACQLFPNGSKVAFSSKDTREALLAYCKLDTLAMVQILGKLRSK